jgi:hypothetical protein
MKIQSGEFIYIEQENNENIRTGSKVGGVKMSIGGNVYINQISPYTREIVLYLTREDCKNLRKLIRESE